MTHTIIVWKCPFEFIPDFDRGVYFTGSLIEPTELPTDREVVSFSWLAIDGRLPTLRPRSPCRQSATKLGHDDRQLADWLRVLSGLAQTPEPLLHPRPVAIAIGQQVASTDLIHRHLGWQLLSKSIAERLDQYRLLQRGTRKPYPVPYRSLDALSGLQGIVLPQRVLSPRRRMEQLLESAHPFSEAARSY